MYFLWDRWGLGYKIFILQISLFTRKLTGNYTALPFVKTFKNSLFIYS